MADGIVAAAATYGAKGGLRELPVEPVHVFTCRPRAEGQPTARVRQQPPRAGRPREQRKSEILWRHVRTQRARMKPMDSSSAPALGVSRFHSQGNRSCAVKEQTHFTIWAFQVDAGDVLAHSRSAQATFSIPCGAFRERADASYSDSPGNRVASEGWLDLFAVTRSDAEPVTCASKGSSGSAQASDHAQLAIAHGEPTRGAMLSRRVNSICR